MLVTIANKSKNLTFLFFGVEINCRNNSLWFLSVWKDKQTKDKTCAFPQCKADPKWIHNLVSTNATRVLPFYSLIWRKVYPRTPQCGLINTWGLEKKSPLCLCFQDSHLSTGLEEKSISALMIPLWMNSDVGSDKDKRRKPFCVLHAIWKILKIKDSVFFIMRQKCYECKQRNTVLWLRTLGQDSALQLHWPEGLTNRKSYSEIDDTDTNLGGEAYVLMVVGLEGFETNNLYVRVHT